MKTLFFSIMLCTAGFTLSGQPRFTAEAERKADGIVERMTVDEKLALVSGVNWMYTKPLERFGIPSMRMSDGPQGLGTHGKSTAYPCAVMLAATWNTDLAYAYGTALGRDSRAREVNVLLGPAVNIYRAPMCGRNFEYMGEDPYLAGQIAAGYIRGVQDQGVMATVKHFVANNSDYDRFNISNDIDERTLHEIYFPAYRTAIEEGGVGALMTSYNLLDGIYTTESPRLLKGVVREKWGFRGLVMSDWGSTHYCIPAVKAGLDLEMPGGVLKPKEMKYYLCTGDLSMEMIDNMVRNILRTMIAFGFDKPLPKTDIPLDDPASARTALKVAEEGIVLLKNTKNILPVDPAKVKEIVVVGNNANGYIKGGGSGAVKPFHHVGAFDGIRAVAQRHGVKVSYADLSDFLPAILYTAPGSSEKGLRAEYYPTMLPEGKPLLVQTENKFKYLKSNGTDIKGMPEDQFSIRWKGVLRSAKSAEYDFTVGGDDGFRVIISNSAAVDDWNPGQYRTRTFTKKLEAGREYPIVVEYFQDKGDAAFDFTWKEVGGDTERPFVERLNKAGLVVACFGFNAHTEGEGHDRTFELPKPEQKLLANVLRTSAPMIGVVNAGGNVAMQDWEPSLSGLLWAWYGGQEAGTAIGKVLFGETNPSGKLPMTFEKQWRDNPAFGSYHDPDGDKHVKYTEGIFIGYRGYDKLGREVQYPFGYGLSYTRFTLSDGRARQLPDGGIEVTCTLRNTGRREGAEVVQLYVNKGDRFVENPEKELKAFRKTNLEPGASEKVTFTLPRNAFSWYDVAAGDFVTKPGNYGIMLGFSSRDIKQTLRVDVK